MFKILQKARGSLRTAKSFRPFSTNQSGKKFDLAVIGSGPGGYVAAIKAGQLGLKVACIEKRATLGGTCLNVGCIPSKALLNSTHHYDTIKNGVNKHGIEVSGVKVKLDKMLENKNQIVNSLTQGIAGLFRKNKVEWIKGTAKLHSDKQITVTSNEGTVSNISAENVIIATGSESRSLPGIEIDEVDIVSSTGALDFKEVPKHLVIVGAGVIGLEMGSVWSRLGSKVTVVEFMDRVVPSLDSELAVEFTKMLKKQGFKFLFGSGVQSISKNAEGLTLKIKNAKTGQESSLSCDKVLVAVGRRPYFDSLGVEEAGIETEKGMIKTNSELNTNIPGVYAIGDVVSGPQLAHKAEEEGILVVEKIAGKSPHINYDAIPSVVYTHPELASVGKTEDELKKYNIPYNKGKFPFLANSRGKAEGDHEGFVKILADKKTDRVLGAHIIGNQAGDLIQECCMAINYGGSSEDIARTCHAHPTRSEAIKEAALATFDKPIHF